MEIPEERCWVIGGRRGHLNLTNTGSDHQRFPSEPVTETSNDGTGDELEEGEERAEEASKQYVVKLSRSSHQTSEQVNLAVWGEIK